MEFWPFHGILAIFMEFWLFSWSSVFVPEKGVELRLSSEKLEIWLLGIFMYYWLDSNLGNKCMLSLEVVMPYWTLEQTRDIILNYGKREVS